jgi:uncharacterized DUF497 family protein
VQGFEWDPRKEHRNEKKHGIGFELAASIFDDPYLLLEEDRNVDGEGRVRAIGSAGEAILLLVAHTVRGEDDKETGVEIIRIISARRADKKERRRYGEARSNAG